VVIIDEGDEVRREPDNTERGDKTGLDGIYQGLGSMPVDIGPMMGLSRILLRSILKWSRRSQQIGNVDMLFTRGLGKSDRCHLQQLLQGV